MGSSEVMTNKPMHDKTIKMTCVHKENSIQPSWADPEVKIHKNIGFLSNTGPDPLKNHKATKPATMLAIIGPPAKRHLNGVSLADR